MQIVSPRVVELFVFQLPSCRFSSGFPYPFHNPHPPSSLSVCVQRLGKSVCNVSCKGEEEELRVFMWVQRGV